MNLNKANLAVGKVALKGASRYSITGIRVTDKYTAATDGYRLAIVGLPPQIPEDEVPGTIKTGLAKQIKAFSVPASVAKDVKFFKSRLPILANTAFIDVQASNKNGTAKFMSTDLQTTSAPEVSKIEDNNFPGSNDPQGIFRYFPENDLHTHSQTVNIDLLIGLLEVAKEVSPYITIKIPEYQEDTFKNIIEFYAKSDDKQEFLGLLMPIRQ